VAAIAERDRELHAIVDLDTDGALAAARAADRERADGGWLGPLHGVPVTVKDVIDVAGLRTRAGSDAYDERPTREGTAVARLRAAGAIVLAKVSTHEFALGVTNPQSRNPHDPARIPGGSSGGSAIAVATGMGLGSLGTDTRASIRVPSSLSGVVGIKATAGVVPTDGIVSLSWTMDHLGPLAASVGDAARLLDVLAGPVFGGGLAAEADAARTEPTLPHVDGRRIRIGVPSAGLDGGDGDVVTAVGHAVARLVELGAEQVDAERPSSADFDDANATGLLISRTEAAAAHRAIGTDLDRCWPETADQLRAAADVTAVEYLDAQRRRGQLAQELLAGFADVDVLVLPTTLVTAPLVEDAGEYLMVLSRNAIPFSLVGFPALSLPCGRDRRGLPIGLQLVAPPHHERRLVAVASRLEASWREWPS